MIAQQTTRGLLKALEAVVGTTLEKVGVDIQAAPVDKTSAESAEQVDASKVGDHTQFAGRARWFAA